MYIVCIDYSIHPMIKVVQTLYIFNIPDLKVKFKCSSKATKLCIIFPLLLTTVHLNNSKVKISQNFAAFSEFMNFNKNVLKASFVGEIMVD